jgi:DNA-binding MarR family transcriptional regulator
MSDVVPESEAARLAALAADLRVQFGRLKRRLREQAHPGDLTISQMAVLVHLEREGSATVTALAKAEGVRSQSMGATISALEAAGLVRGAPHPTDGRQTILSITDACRDWIRANRAAREDWLARTIHATLTPAEQAQLAGAVELIKRLVDS